MFSIFSIQSGCDRSGWGGEVVSCPDYFSHTEGKIVWSTVYSIFVPCDSELVTQRLQKCYVLSHKACNYKRAPKRRLHCRDHPTQSFQMPRNKDSQSMKSLSTSESPETSCRHLKAQEFHTASFQAQRHIPPVHRSPDIPSLVVLSLLHSASSA